MSIEREPMTLEQALENMRDERNTSRFVIEVSIQAFDRWIAAITAHLAREKAEPVYQIYAGGNWRDYTREEYEATEIKTKRILYTHPTAPAEADERLRDFAKDIMRAWPEGGVDGGELQEAALRHGLIEPATPTQEERDEWGLDEGDAWYRKTALLTPWINAPREAPQESGDGSRSR